MSVCHVVTFTFKPETADEAVATFAQGLDHLAERLKLNSFRHGRDLGLHNGNADYAVVAEFDDEAEFAAYLSSPSHQQLIRELLLPHLQTRSAVQFVI